MSMSQLEPDATLLSCVRVSKETPMRKTPAWPGVALLRAGVFVGIVVGGLVAASPALAQDDPKKQDDLRKDVEELKKGQQQILQQLQELKQMIQSQARPAAPAGPNVKDVVFDLGANPTLGSERASLMLVEFTDYQ
jgi:septal ring factor EnvC (AmiA/AmiB activator)